MSEAARLNAVQAGSEGPWLVLLHGFGGLAAVWQSIMPALSGYARIIAYDLPGHGRSADYPGAGPVKVAVRAVLEDLDRRGIARAHLAGHSMGGAIAVLVALNAPDRVASLTLLAPGGMGEEINRAQLLALAKAKTSEELAAALADMSAPSAIQNANPLLVLAEGRALLGQTEMLLGIAEHITRGGRQGVIPAEQLARLTMPVTVIWGKKDPTLPHHQTAHLPPSFRVVSLDGVGHMVIDEAPGPVIDALKTAVATVQG